MKAVVYDRYGPPDVLRIEEVPTPSPAADQALIKVAATSINLSDWEFLRGSPLYARIGGLRSPTRPERTTQFECVNFLRTYCATSSRVR